MIAVVVQRLISILEGAIYGCAVSMNRVAIPPLITNSELSKAIIAQNQKPLPNGMLNMIKLNRCLKCEDDAKFDIDGGDYLCVECSSPHCENGTVAIYVNDFDEFADAARKSQGLWNDANQLNNKED